VKTDELIAMLARGPVAADPRTTERQLALAVSVGAVAALVLVVATLGLHPDLAALSRLPAFWLKLLFPLTLALAAYKAATLLARPGHVLGPVRAALAAPFVIVWVIAAVQWLQAPVEERGELLLGNTALSCVVLVSLFALPTFAAACVALRSLAPTRLREAGGCAGLLAGAVSATVYVFHCDEMTAPFIAIWYALGITVPGVLGWLLGPRLLRWS
jgi:hypothetical protein